MLFRYHDDFQMRPVATFHASQLVTGHWIQAGDGRHEVHAATTDLRSADGHPMVTAYGLRRPDGRLAVLLFDKDPARHRRAADRLGRRERPARRGPRAVQLLRRAVGLVPGGG
jgi:hypothetical protein